MTNTASLTTHSIPSQAPKIEKYEFRCYNCHKLLGKSYTQEFKQFEIKCPRCRVINEV